MHLAKSNNSDSQLFDEIIARNIAKSDQIKLNRFINKGIKQNISLNKASNEEDTPQFGDIDYVNFEDLSSVF